MLLHMQYFSEMDLMSSGIPYSRFWLCCDKQWHNPIPVFECVVTNSGVTGGECPPEIFDPEISADLSGKERQGKIEQKRRKIEKGKVENWKWKEEKLQNEERTFFFFFFAFQTTEICFGSTKMGIFYQGKSISHREKKIRKNNFALSEKHSSYAPGDDK